MPRALLLVPRQLQQKNNSGEKDYTAANVDLKSGKGLPIADMSQSIEVRGDGKGMRYFQNGKEVRMPKK